MAFSWFSKPQKDAKTLGVNLNSGDGIKAEIDKMQGSIVKASKGYQTNIKKYKEIAEFNQHLTKSYVANLKVIVDVSELLNSYSGVFNSLKDEFAKMEEVMGRQLDKSDFEYLESLTKSKMDELNNEFAKQANGIKRLYSQYGKPEELNRILLAQNNMQKALEQANSTYSNITKDVEEVNKLTNVRTNIKSNVRSMNSSRVVPLSSTENIILSQQELVNATLNNNKELQAGGKSQKSKSRKVPAPKKTSTNKQTIKK
jgi:hypothetical protein